MIDARLKPGFPAELFCDEATAGTVTRRGKVIDLEAGGLHLVFHLARAGWLRWKAVQPDAPARPGNRARAAGDDAAAAGALTAGRSMAAVIGVDPLSNCFSS